MSHEEPPKPDPDLAYDIKLANVWEKRYILSGSPPLAQPAWLALLGTISTVRRHERDEIRLIVEDVKADSFTSPGAACEEILRRIWGRG